MFLGIDLGRSGVILVARDGYHPAPSSAVHTFCHAVPGRWYQMGVKSAATDSLNWLARKLGADARSMAEKAGSKIGAPSSVQFPPYLSGERTPHNDSKIGGAFLNLDIGSNRTDLIRAVMVGVIFALRDCPEALKSTGSEATRLLCIGGGARSDYWVELTATARSIPIDLPAKGEFGAALGAARLAMTAAIGGNPDKITARPEIGKTVMPQTELAPAYEAAYQNWRSIYPTIKDLK